MDNFKQAALNYASDGIAVFPVIANGKKPCTPNGCKDAKTDKRAINYWWDKWECSNIGIATGPTSRLVVIDLDISDEKGKDGYKELEKWQEVNGKFPQTARALSGSGGMHYYFRTDEKYKNRAGILPGVDVRGEGGYIVAPPSIHPNGNAYKWIESPEEVGIAEVDEVVKKFLSMKEVEKSHPDANGLPTKKFVLPIGAIPSGQRNDTIFRLASSLQSQGFSDAAISAAVNQVNVEQCSPPLESAEVETLINQALQYNKGESKIIKKEMPEVRDPKIALNEKGLPIQSIDNMVEALSYDNELFGRIKYNSLTYAISVRGNLPWRDYKGIREWDNNDDSNLKCYIEKKYQFKDFTRLMEALTVVATAHRYNPVQNFLEECASQWDGNKYIENLLPNYLGVEKNEYTTECLKLFMLGAISRIYHPGCKFDYVLVLVGGQGIGKSSFIKALAGNEAYYNDNFNTIEGDKACEKLNGIWIAEMAELMATKKAKDVEAFKSFVTSQYDKYRPPYGRRTENRPRMCVFAATTNNDHFMTDRTGNRRYLPIKTNQDNVKININKNWIATLATFRQAWGEAMDLFKQANGKPELVLSAGVQKKALEEQQEYLEEDSRIGVIQEWLKNTKENRVCVQMIWSECLGCYEFPNKQQSNQLHEILSQMPNWEKEKKRQRCGKYGVAVCYSRIKQEIINDCPF